MLLLFLQLLFVAALERDGADAWGPAQPPPETPPTPEREIAAGVKGMPKQQFELEALVNAR